MEKKPGLARRVYVGLLSFSVECSKSNTGRHHYTGFPRTKRKCRFCGCMERVLH